MLVGGLLGCSEPPTVSLARVPDGGLQPRVQMDPEGQAHLVYFRPDSRSGRTRLGQLVYRQGDPARGDWGPALTVSTDRYAHGDPIYRADFAVADDGRIHAVWYQPEPGEFFYARSDLARTAFEPQRRIVSEQLAGIDAGIALAVQGMQVALVWAAGDLSREESRTVFVRRSTDGGETFGSEQRLGDPAMGACACCSLAASLDTRGTLTVAYRSAIAGTGRHMQIVQQDLLGTEGGAVHYRAPEDLRHWDLAACPVSTNDWVASATHGELLVYEQLNRIAWLALSGETAAWVAPQIPDTRQKHPALAVDPAGRMLVAWGEGPGFVSGGQLHWQLLDSEGQPLRAGAPESVTIPDYSAVAVMATAAGFTVLY